MIAAFSLLRIGLASVVELGNDEAYYWFYTLQLQWNYFDHPPMVALWGRLFTFNLALDHYEVFVRLGSIVSCALATWFLFRATATLHSEKAGWYAAVLYNTSFYAGVVSGLLIMPDSPQMVFWTLSLWMMARIMKAGASWANWILFGAAAGLCIMSKVHGVFIWTGLALFLIFKKRDWLLRPQLYVSLLVTLALISPILIWNLQHDFATYRFHSQRVTIGGGVDTGNFFSELIGQIFFNNPVNVILAAVTMGSLLRLKKIPVHHFYFLFTGLPLALILLFISLFKPVFPHWSGPAYITLIPLAAIYLASLRYKPDAGRWLRWSAGAAVVFLLGWPALIQFYPGTWGSKNYFEYGKGDVSLDRYGWEEAGQEFIRFYREEIRSGSIPAQTAIVCNTWWGAHVEYYFCRPAGLTMMGLGNMKQIHHYMWTNAERRHRANLETSFTIVPSDEYFDVKKHYTNYYDRIELVKTIELKRSGHTAHRFFVYRLDGWKGQVPLIQ